MRKRTVGLYNPYLATLGGGERHILSILQVIAETFDAEVRIYWPEDLSDQIAQKLDLRFPTKPLFSSVPFHTKTGAYERMKALSELDLLLYVTDGSYFFSAATKTAIFCMVPNPDLYRMSLINRLKTQSNLFITNSYYTHDWLTRWKIDNTVLYPYVSDAFFGTSLVKNGTSSSDHHGQDTAQKTVQRPQKKRPVILTVGRFFQGLHAKRQDLAIETFQQLQTTDPRFAKYQLVLAGSVDPADQATIDALTEQIAGNPQITLAVNPPFQELVSYYQEAQFYWHFAGYDVEVNQHPHHVEHLGITPLEAMASGCLTCCYGAGGPLELIQENHNGVLFQTKDELVQQMSALLSDEDRMNTIVSNGYSFVNDNFSYQPFVARVKELFQAYL